MEYEYRPLLYLLYRLSVAANETDTLIEMIDDNSSNYDDCPCCVSYPPDEYEDDY